MMVFINDLEDQNVSEGEGEDLLYVGMSRAISKLIIYNVA